MSTIREMAIKKMKPFDVYQPDKELRPIVVSLSDIRESDASRGRPSVDLFSHRLHGVTLIRPKGIKTSFSLNLDQGKLPKDFVKKFYGPYHEKIHSLVGELSKALNQKVIFVDFCVGDDLGHDIVIDAPPSFPSQILEPLLYNLTVSKYDFVRGRAEHGRALVDSTISACKNAFAFQLNVDSRLDVKTGDGVGAYTKIQRIFEENIVYAALFCTQFNEKKAN